MLLTTLPFDYAVLLDSGDRVRTKGTRTSGTRVRRTPSARQELGTIDADLRDSRERLPPDQAPEWTRRGHDGRRAEDDRRGRGSRPSRPGRDRRDRHHDGRERRSPRAEDRAEGQVPLGPDPDHVGRRLRVSRHVPSGRRPRVRRRVDRSSCRRRARRGRSQHGVRRYQAPVDSWRSAGEDGQRRRLGRRRSRARRRW